MMISCNFVGILGIIKKRVKILLKLVYAVGDPRLSVEKWAQ